MNQFNIIVIIFFYLSFASVSYPQDKINTGSEKELFEKNIGKLYQEKKFDEILLLLEDGITKYPEDKLDLVKSKFGVAMEAGKYFEATKAVIRWDDLTERSNANRALLVAKPFLLMNDFDNAFKWINTSVDRGFQNYFIFYENDFWKPIKDDKRMNEIIKKMKSKIGFGEKIKHFDRVSLNGMKLSPSKLKGKVFMIDFWATWCEPCLKTIPNLKKLYEKYKDEGFEIVSISLDREKDREKLLKYINDNKISWPVIFSGEGWKDKTKENFGIKNIPSLWIVDKFYSIYCKGITGIFQFR